MLNRKSLVELRIKYLRSIACESVPRLALLVMGDYRATARGPAQDRETSQPGPLRARRRKPFIGFQTGDVSCKRPTMARAEADYVYWRWSMLLWIFWSLHQISRSAVIDKATVLKKATPSEHGAFAPLCALCRAAQWVASSARHWPMASFSTASPTPSSAPGRTQPRLPAKDDLEVPEPPANAWLVADTCCVVVGYVQP